MEHYYDTQVRDILSSVITQLKNDKKKRFIWAETCYLQKFYDELKNEDLKAVVRELVETGQLELVGGGWVQHDETLTTY